MNDVAPELFSCDAIDPDTAAFNAELEQKMNAAPPRYALSPTTNREQQRTGTGIFPPPVYDDQATDRSIPGPGGAVTMRQILPKSIRGVYLHIHGGGWMLGGHDLQDPSLKALSEACDLAVLSVNYRLAPEHPHPAGADDCQVAAEWLLSHGKSEFGSDHYLIGGESAGAHLSSVTLQRLRAANTERIGTGFCGANLVYGAYDLGFTPSVLNWGERPLVLTTKTIAWFTNHYLQGQAPRDPDVSPLYGDLSGMPPALFTVGTLDPLLDDTLFMAARWQAAVNRTELKIYPGGIHGFNLFPTPLGQKATLAVYDFMKRVIG